MKCPCCKLETHKKGAFCSQCGSPIPSLNIEVDNNSLFQAETARCIYFRMSACINHPIEGIKLTLKSPLFRFWFSSSGGQFNNHKIEVDLDSIISPSPVQVAIDLAPLSHASDASLYFFFEYTCNGKREHLIGRRSALILPPVNTIGSQTQINTYVNNMQEAFGQDNSPHIQADSSLNSQLQELRRFYNEMSDRAPAWREAALTKVEILPLTKVDSDQKKMTSSSNFTNGDAIPLQDNDALDRDIKTSLPTNHKDELVDPGRPTNQFETSIDSNQLISPEDVIEMLQLTQDHKPKTYLRCHFTDNKDGTVTDAENRLKWKRTGSVKRYTYQDVREYIARFNRDSGSGNQLWRLPTIRELVGLIASNPNADGKHIDAVFTVEDWYWSSVRRSESIVYCVDFSRGVVDWGSAEHGNYVLPVKTLLKNGSL